MMMRLNEKGKKVSTTFRLSPAEYNTMKSFFEGMTPTKKSSRYIYFEIEGNMITPQKEAK